MAAFSGASMRPVNRGSWTGITGIRPAGLASLVSIAVFVAFVSPPDLQSASPRTAGGGQRSGREWLLKMERARVLLVERRYGEAVPLLEQICAEVPSLASAVGMLAESYIKIGRPEDARDLLERRLETEPYRFDFLEVLGNVYLDLGEKNRAIETWRRVLEAGKGSRMYLSRIANLEAGAGLYEEALETLREARSLDGGREDYTLEIIRLERLMGRDEAAFREALVYLGGRGEEVDLRAVQPALEVFRESEDPNRLFAVIDSISGASGGSFGAFRALRSLLLAELGRFDEAESSLFEGGPGERELYSLVDFLYRMRRMERNEGFELFLESSMESFIERFGESASVPPVMLMMAGALEERASGSMPPGAGDYGRALELADDLLRHPMAAPYRDKALAVKARIFLDGYQEPDSALEALAEINPLAGKRGYELEMLRVRAYLASGRWGEAEAYAEVLAESGDSTKSALGRYGLGMVHFMCGRYEEAVEVLSALAERYVWSRWANDALETAILIRRGDDEPLDLYRAALSSAAKGDIDSALGILGALEKDFGSSIVVPRGAFLAAELQAAGGRAGEAEKSLRRIAEVYPLDDVAPRSLERLGELLETDRPMEALDTYASILRKYPADPFLGRVRRRYIELRKRLEGESAR